MVILHLVEGSPRIDPAREHHHHPNRTQAQAKVRVLDHVGSEERRNGKHPGVLRAGEQVERRAIQDVHNLWQRRRGETKEQGKLALWRKLSKFYFKLNPTTLVIPCKSFSFKKIL